MTTKNMGKQTILMTPEMLRKHWFESRRVPFWNYDPNQLTVGLEIEYFIAKVDGPAFKLATKAQYMMVIEELVKTHGYKDLDLADQPGRVSKDTENGFIAIKPDFAWHILEIALPPRSDLESLRKLLITTFSEVDAALAKFGLERLDISCLPDIPEHFELVELDRLGGYLKGSNEQLRIFPALIAATHVHLNCSSEDALRKLPDLYSAEQEAQRLYTRAKYFQGKEYVNVRTKFYEEAFGEAYLLKATPNVIPKSIDDYVDQLNRSEKIFPFDKFFAARDMSYIRPTNHGTFEFRSSCSFKDITVLLRIVEFRLKKVCEVYSPEITPSRRQA